MDIGLLCKLFNEIVALPSSILFIGTALFLTVRTGFLQIRGIARFVRLVSQGIKTSQKKGYTINAFHALFTSMATTIGIGNVVGPGLAIRVGGPGALFWLLVYMFFAAATKFTEVTFALETRTVTVDGNIIGGPMQYLRTVSNTLAYWYGGVMSCLFIYWSSVQSNTIASIFVLEGVQEWVIGLSLAIVVGITLMGGARRVGLVASKLVPLMFVLYVGFSLFILCKDSTALYCALVLIKQNIFTPSAAMGGFIGATVLQAMHAGVYRAVFISEAGLGVSSIPHAVADTKRPTDQAILAMFSVVADSTLSLISGLLVLVTGIWMHGEFRSTMIYEVFKMHCPGIGQLILLVSIVLFVLTTVMGNSFNGMQCFAALTKRRWMQSYMMCAVTSIFVGALLPVTTVWHIMDTLLILTALPNIIGLLVLVFRYPHVLKK